MDDKLYNVVLRQERFNNRQRIFNIAALVALFWCANKISYLHDKIDLIKNNNEVSEKMKGE
jgi:hypothetical protein